MNSEGDERDKTGAAPAAPVWRRLVDAVRAGAHELGEAIADSQALRILDQEIRDADDELHRAKDALAEMLAHCKVALDRRDASAKRVEEYEGYALKALRAADDALAREVAAKVVAFEEERDADDLRVRELTARVAEMRKAIAQAEAHIKRLKQQVDTVRATETVQRAQLAVAHRHAGGDSRLRTALDSLERIKHRQAARAARMDAAVEPEGEGAADDLEKKLREAGIIDEPNGPDAVLARLKRRI